MRVVSNTSPVSNLAIIGRLGLLRAKFGRVTVPDMVHDELARLAHAAGSAAVRQAMAEGWLEVKAVPDRTMIPVLLNRIDPGEAEALELARQTKADLLLLDDSDARQIAREELLPFTGVLGLLAEEVIAGRIPSLRAEIQRLRVECRFFVSGKVENMMLSGVGE